MNTLSKFLIGAACVFGFTMMVNEALADHNDNPYWLVTYEYTNNMTAVTLSDEFGPMRYDTADLCEKRGLALGAYLEEHTEVIGVVTCLHSYGRPIEEVIDDVGQYFADQLPQPAPATTPSTWTWI